MTSTPKPLPCPHCGTALDLMLSECTTCGLRLRGPQAGRLWEVDQQLAALSSERKDLIATLLADPEPIASAPGSPPLAPARRRTSPTGQQLLLGLGALLLLSAATFFGVVVWLIVGVWGQAVLLCVMTGLAVAGTVVATRRRLPAAAETGAVLASGLTAVGFWAAWSLDLGGLHGVSSTLYAGLAALVIGVLVLGYDRLVPRRGRDGEPLRRVLSYRPVATTVLSSAPWWLLVEAAPRGVWLTVGLGLVTLVTGGLWFLTLRLEGTQLRDMTYAARPPAIGTGTAAALYVVVGLAVAHDLTTPTREWSALLLLVTAAGLAAVAGRLSLPAPVARWVPVLVTLIAAPAAWSYTWEAPWILLAAAAAIIALAVVGVAYSPLINAGTTARRCAQVVAGAAGAGLTLDLLLLHLADEPALSGDAVGSGPDLWLVSAVAALWVAAAVVVTARLQSMWWLLFAHLALTATLLIALLDSSDRTQTVTWLVAGLVLAGVAAGAVVRVDAADGRFTGWDLPPSVFAAGFAVMAVMTSVALPHPWTAWTLIAAGVAAFAFALLPGRLAVAYVAAPVISLGVGLLASHAGWDVIEAYTWPLAVLLAAIGGLHWSRDRNVRSRISMGPALSVALLPSVLTAIDAGDAGRLAVGTAAGVILLVVGLVLRLQAPVAVATVALVLVALTQGGPYLALVPGWITLGLAGLVLLTIGVSWERAVVAGRRSNAWFSHLQ